ncbi:signal transduction histidine kinase [Azospirillum canadense]|nr:signal transduction histidine kinase [Azospirillum canadense]
MSEYIQKSIDEGHMSDRMAWLEALVSANGVGHALLAPDGRLLVVNTAFAAAFGCLPDDVEGKGLDALGIPAALVPQITAQLRRVAATGNPLTIQGVLPQGEVMLTPVRDADGAVTAIAAIGDVNAAALAAARAEAERARAEAARARADLEKVQAGSARFLSAASHDLRQPFQAMHLFHHLLMGRLTDPASRDLGDKLEQAITGGETLLRALLEVSALEAGTVKVQPQVFPIDETLGRLLQEFAPEAEAKGLRFNVRPAEAEVATDPVLLERLLRPLLSNALRYTEKGGVLLAARRRGDGLRLEVWDTGIGIARPTKRRSSRISASSAPPTAIASRGWGWGSPSRGACRSCWGCPSRCAPGRARAPSSRSTSRSPARIKRATWWARPRRLKSRRPDVPNPRSRRVVTPTLAPAPSPIRATPHRCSASIFHAGGQGSSGPRRPRAVSRLPMGGAHGPGDDKGLGLALGRRGAGRRPAVRGDVRERDLSR